MGILTKHIWLVFFFNSSSGTVSFVPEVNAQPPQRRQKCLAPSPGVFFWIVSIWCLSLHAVAAGLKSWLGPVAGESGLAQDTVALGGP